MKNKALVIFLSIIMFFIGGVAGVGGLAYITLPYSEELVETDRVYYSLSDKDNTVAVASGVQEAQEGAVSVHFLELGNKYAGDCTYIKVGTDIDILIDCGSKTNSIATVSAYLNNYVTDGTLEYVIITHAHEDHYAGFATTTKIDSIFDLYECETIITFSNTNQRTSADYIQQSISTSEEISIHGITSYANTNNKPVSKMYANFNRELADEINNGATHLIASDVINQYTDGKIVLDEENNIDLQILNSQYYSTKAGSDNDYSVCAMVNQGDKHFIFTGDLEADGEEFLVQLNNLPQVELYKAGHHGSKTSSTMALLNVIKPKIVCVCCCAGSKEYTETEANQFPTKKFINHVSQFTTQVYVTTLCVDYDNDVFTSFNGNIVVMAKKDDIEVSVYCSNNTIVLKDTDWFKTERLEMCKLPDKDGKDEVLLHPSWYETAS